MCVPTVPCVATCFCLQTLVPLGVFPLRDELAFEVEADFQLNRIALQLIYETDYDTDMVVVELQTNVPWNSLKFTN